MASFMLNYLWADALVVWQLKLTNLIIHLINGVLIYLIFARLLKVTNFRDHRYALAGTISCIWLLAPLHVSTVLYVIQRMTQLSALFVLLGCYAYITARVATVLEGKKFRRATFFLIVLLGLLAVLSKENGILLPLYLLIFELCFFRFAGFVWSPARIKQVIVLLFGVMVIGSVLFLVFHPSYYDYQERNFTLEQRLLTQPRILFDYMAQLFLPANFDPGIYSDDFVLSASLMRPITTLLSVIGLLALLTVSLILMRNRTWGVIVAGILFYFAGHTLESTFLNLEIYFQHRNYLPAVGLIAAFCLLMDQLFKRVISRHVAALVLLCYLTYLGMFTSQRALAWANYTTFVVTSVKYHPNSIRALRDLASIQMERGDLAGSLQTMDNLTQRSPNEVSLRVQRFAVYCQLAQSMPAREYADLAQHLSLYRPVEIATAMANFLQVYRQKQCDFIDLNKMVVIWYQWLTLQWQSGQISARDSWSVEYYLIEMLLELGRKQEAYASLLHSMNLKNYYAGFFLVDLYVRSGEYVKAKQVLEDNVANMNNKNKEKFSELIDKLNATLSNL